MKLSRLLALTLLAPLLLTGCDFFALNTVNYNNRVVEQMTELSESVNASSDAYDRAFPDDALTEEDDFDVTEMEAALSEVLINLKGIEHLPTLRAKNTAQREDVAFALSDYLEAGEAYMKTYEELLTYYQDELYREDITKVKFHDDALYAAYTDFVHANNELAEVLEGFVE